MTTKNYNLICGDAHEQLNRLDSESVDSIVTDPPAGIAFMGKSWDSDKGGRDTWILWLTEIMTEAKGVLKPGGHALVWALPRTSHWTATALENSGFEIRDIVNHIFGSGFPKSLNVGNGLGTALKPACENWILCRKPLEKGLTVAQNVLKWGTGAINVDGCRVPSDRKDTRHGGGKVSEHIQQLNPDAKGYSLPSARFPANVTHDGSDEVEAEFAKFGERKSGAINGKRSASRLNCHGGFAMQNEAGYFEATAGSASRFFYAAKASQSDRNEGLEGFEIKRPDHRTETGMGSFEQKGVQPQQNHHPTVKNVELMKYLCRLITPPNGIILDMFCGSGSTGKAAMLENFRFIGIEQNAEYLEIARARIESALNKQPLFAAA